MKRTIPAWSGVAMAVLVPAWLLSVPAAASAQAKTAGGGGGSSSSGSSGGSSGGGHASSGGSSGGGGGHASAGGGGGGHMSAGGGGDRGGSGGGHMSGGPTSHAGGGGATMRGPSGGSSSGSSAGSTGGATARGNGVGDGAGYRGDPGGRTNARTDPVPPYSRPRDGQPVVGTAVPRTGPPPATGGGIPGYYGGYYPWAFGGLGFGGYYGGYYDPCFDPYYGGFGCGGGFYGPPTYSSGSSIDEGAIHLKIKPKDAAVYVDGYYVGIVDDFDGLFQKLHMEAGPHRIEVRAPGYETLTLDVNVEADQTTTYRGELKKLQ